MTDPSGKRENSFPTSIYRGKPGGWTIPWVKTPVASSALSKP